MFGNKKCAYQKLSPDDVAATRTNEKFITVVCNKPTKDTPIGLGWGIVEDSICLTRIAENGLAIQQQQSNDLRKGMKLISINGIDFSSAKDRESFLCNEGMRGLGGVQTTKTTLADATKVLRNAEGTVTIILATPQLVSIKESDRYTGEDRMIGIMTGMGLMIFGIVGFFASLIAGWFVPAFGALIIIGPVFTVKACFADYYGKIKIIQVLNDRRCPECNTEGSLEIYEDHQRKIIEYNPEVPLETYEEYRRSQIYSTNIHCMNCRCKCVYSRNVMDRIDAVDPKPKAAGTSRTCGWLAPSTVANSNSTGDGGGGSSSKELEMAAPALPNIV